eukprot:3476040-Pyramimonas_sp.AAC.1
MFGLIYEEDRTRDVHWRRQTADALITADPDQLDIATRNVRSTFMGELRVVQATGTCPPRL